MYEMLCIIDFLTRPALVLKKQGTRNLGMGVEGDTTKGATQCNVNVYERLSYLILIPARLLVIFENFPNIWRVVAPALCPLSPMPMEKRK